MLPYDVPTSIIAQMATNPTRRPPGKVRDSILQVLSFTSSALSVKEIESRVQAVGGAVPPSSIRSYLRLNTPKMFVREGRGVYRLRGAADPAVPMLQRDLSAEPGCPQPYSFGKSQLFHADCFDWLAARDGHRFHAVVTDPPYGLHEYSSEQQHKRRSGRGGVWRIPPSFDGNTRSPLPRFTTLTRGQIDHLASFFFTWGRLLLPRLVPGAHVVVASNPLVSYVVSGALADAGLERRGEIVRLTMTMRGGDRPKAAHREFRNVSMMPRSMWEPWLVYRKPLEGRARDNLDKWGTGGFRRPEADKPFGDVVASSPTRKREKSLAPHPSLKPQAFMRQLVHAALPLGKGIVLDPFAGSGATLAAAEVVGYASVGVEKDSEFFSLARESIPKLAAFEPNGTASVCTSSYPESLLIPATGATPN